MGYSQKTSLQFRSKTFLTFSYRPRLIHLFPQVQFFFFFLLYLLFAKNVFLHVSTFVFCTNLHFTTSSERKENYVFSIAMLPLLYLINSTGTHGMDAQTIDFALCSARCTSTPLIVITGLIWLQFEQPSSSTRWSSIRIHTLSSQNRKGINLYNVFT